MKVPFVDLRSMHEEVRQEFNTAFNDILDKSSFVGGPYVSSFEENFASYCGAKHAIACANGTDAVRLALKAAGIRSGDGVFVPANTFIASVEGITSVKALPVFLDIDAATFHISVESLQYYLENECRLGADGHWVDNRTGARMTAILPVHLFGMIVDIEPILEISKKYNLTIVEDAAQAHGASYRLHENERRAGSFGVTAAFSFYPGKNLGALGEGGAVTTDDPSANEKIRMWQDHGSIQKYIHISPDGWNSRLSTIQCAFLDIKLKKLDEWNDRRRQVAAWYQKYLQDIEEVILPIVPLGRVHVYHLYVIRIRDRERIRQALVEQGIGCGLHYPIPLHLQKAYSDLGYKQGDFPVAEESAETILSLPMFPHLTEEMVKFVSKAIRELI